MVKIKHSKSYLFWHNNLGNTFVLLIAQQKQKETTSGEKVPIGALLDSVDDIIIPMWDPLPSSTVPSPRTKTIPL